jgi:peptide/nickel transport system permease protein
MVLMVAVCAVLAGLIADFAPSQMNYQARLLPPGNDHWFGTDSFGRDVFCRVLFGARASLEIGLGALVITGLMGGLLGVIASHWRVLDNLIMRAMDAMMAFPTILLAIAIAAALGPSMSNLMLVLAIAYSPRMARVTRASMMSVRKLEFVEAARALGATSSRILIRHIIPNGLAPVLVELSFVFSAAVLSEAILSFLGVGLPPTLPTLGNIVAEGQNYLWDAPWITVFPGLVIVVTVLGLNLVGDGLRDILDPRIARQRAQR